MSEVTMNHKSSSAASFNTPGIFFHGPVETQHQEPTRCTPAATLDVISCTNTTTVTSSSSSCCPAAAGQNVRVRRADNGRRPDNARRAARRRESYAKMCALRAERDAERQQKRDAAGPQYNKVHLVPTPQVPTPPVQISQSPMIHPIRSGVCSGSPNGSVTISRQVFTVHPVRNVAPPLAHNFKASERNVIPPVSIDPLVYRIPLISRNPLVSRDPLASIALARPADTSSGNVVRADTQRSSDASLTSLGTSVESLLICDSSTKLPVKRSTGDPRDFGDLRIPNATDAATFGDADECDDFGDADACDDFGDADECDDADILNGDTFNSADSTSSFDDCLVAEDFEHLEDFERRLLANSFTPKVDLAPATPPARHAHPEPVKAMLVYPQTSKRDDDCKTHLNPSAKPFVFKDEADTDADASVDFKDFVFENSYADAERELFVFDRTKFRNVDSMDVLKSNIDRFTIELDLKIEEATAYTIAYAKSAVESVLGESTLTTYDSRDRIKIESVVSKNAIEVAESYQDLYVLHDCKVDLARAIMEHNKRAHLQYDSAFASARIQAADSKNTIIRTVNEFTKQRAIWQNLRTERGRANKAKDLDWEKAVSSDLVVVKHNMAILEKEQRLLQTEFNDHYAQVIRGNELLGQYLKAKRRFEYFTSKEAHKKLSDRYVEACAALVMGDFYTSCPLSQIPELYVPVVQEHVITYNDVSFIDLSFLFSDDDAVFS